MERNERGRTYGDSVLKIVLSRLWETVGCPCTTYCVASLGNSA